MWTLVMFLKFHLFFRLLFLLSLVHLAYDLFCIFVAEAFSTLKDEM